MEVTYYGHSCFEITIGGKRILFDPFIRPNSLAKDIKVDEIKPDYILISHGHEDHIADAVEIAKQSNALVLSNYEIVTWLAGKGVENAHPMNHGGIKQLDFGSVKFVNAVHSSMLPDGSYGGNPGGFVIESNDKNIYYSGDTALHYDMNLIGEYSNIDLAFLCIGDNFTMGIDDAVRACDFIECDKVIGMHYDTFPYVVIDKENAKDKFEEAGKELTLFEIGETKNLK